MPERPTGVTCLKDPRVYEGYLPSGVRGIPTHGSREAYTPMVAGRRIHLREQGGTYQRYMGGTYQRYMGGILRREGGLCAEWPSFPRRERETSAQSFSLSDSFWLKVMKEAALLPVIDPTVKRVIGRHPGCPQRECWWENLLRGWGPSLLV